MTASEKVTLIAAVLALAGSILSLFISSRLAIKKERRQLLWSKELDRFFQLEELAGELVGELGSYHALPEGDYLSENMDILHSSAGKFARYDRVRRAILDLHNALGRMVAAKRDHEGREDDLRKELSALYQALLDACDQAVGRPK